MYVPEHFAVTDFAEIQRLLREHPLGMLVRHGEDGLDADHIPFEFDADAGPSGTLRAHVARANPLWRQTPAGAPVMVVFRGAEAFISPNWYPSKRETHREVPTWNYEVVHAHGTFAVREDERFLRELLSRLTRHHEASEPRPWAMTDSAPEYIDRMLRGIVGIEVTITSLVGKSKLSQNKPARDRLGAADTLAERGRDELARRMRRDAAV